VDRSNGGTSFDEVTAAHFSGVGLATSVGLAIRVGASVRSMRDVDGKAGVAVGRSDIFDGEIVQLTRPNPNAQNRMKRKTL